MNQNVLTVINYLNSLTERADLSVLKRILQDADVKVGDFPQSKIFKEDHYARNKVSGSDWYDLYIMCWRPQQASAIHDHAESSCAFRILQGTATEECYVRTPGGATYVQKTDTIYYAPGELCLAQDSQIHKISNESTTENLVTMHIYSPPLKMSTYEVDPAIGMQDAAKVA